MAIAFARIEYVKRSEGKNACCKAAYNKRDKIKDEQTGILYSFGSRGGNVHHEIMLPEGVDSKFLDAEVLWNTVEKFENRKNSQVAKEFVLALPWDRVVTHEDRVELTRRFCKQFFVGKGLGVEFDIHEPHKKIDRTFSDEVDEELHEHIDKNWHAHILVTTRRFSPDGKTFDLKKARDLDAQVRKGKVIEGDLWGKHWKDLQNAYFKEKGYDLQVDEIGIIAQKHLGPVRMRRHKNERQQEVDLLMEANRQVSLIPEHIIDHLAKTYSLFGEKEIEAYLEKHVGDEKKREEIKERVLQSPDLLPLYPDGLKEIKESDVLEDPESIDSNKKKALFYTTQKVREEEKRTLRHAYRVQEKGRIGVDGENVLKEFKFSSEQQEAFQYALQGDSGIKIIEGRAGTGKSYLMQGIRKAYEQEGVSVFGLSPTHLVKTGLEKGGFKKSYTVQGFLFQYMNGRVKVPKKSLFMVDESAMVGNPALGELLKVARETSSKVILFGDTRQLHAISRGGLFSYLVEPLGSSELREVRRQTIFWQKEVSERFSEGDVSSALSLLRDHKRILWDETKEESLSRLIEDWCRGEERGYEKLLERKLKGEASSQEIRIILAHRNIDVDILNQAIHRVRQATGRVDKEEFLVDGDRGRIGFSVGDRVQFGATNKALKIYSGNFGTLVRASVDQFVVESDLGDTITFNPGAYSGLRLGYASTIYKAQGKTVKDAYILHSPWINQNLGYVALTRQTENLRFYVTIQETKSFWHLERQLAREDLKRCSLEFKTEAEIAQEKNLETPTFFQKHVRGRYEDIRTRIDDRNHQNVEFYTVPLKEEKLLREVVQQDVREQWRQEAAEEKAFLKALEKESPPSLNPEGSLGETVKFSSSRKDPLSLDIKPLYDKDQIYHALLKDLKGFGEHLLGGYDSKLSTSHHLCFRVPKEYKIFVEVKTGLWKDFINDVGGNLFTLIMWKRGESFKEALEYAAQYTGEGCEKSSHNLKNVNSNKSFLDSSHRDLEKERQTVLEQALEEERKIRKVEGLYQRSEPIKGTLAEVYLKEHRGIKGDLPQDLRFISSYYNTEMDNTYGALLSFTRDSKGELRAYQVTYLDSSTSYKAEINTPKKTHGVLKGSYVEIQKERGPIYMAEGVETALSLREAGIKGTILASLGTQNIKNYEGRYFTEERSLIIVGDHDGEKSKTEIVLEKASLALQEKGYTLQIIKPAIEGQDFNDVLREEGKERVFEYFKETQQQKEILSRGQEESFREEQSTVLSDLLHAHSLSGENSQEKTKNSREDQKAAEKVKKKDLEPLSFDVLYKKYMDNLKILCKEQIGDDYKKYLPEIKKTAERTSQLSLIEGHVFEGKEREAIFARAQYEVRRAQELEEKAIVTQEDFASTWMNDRLMAEVRARCEGSVYQTLRAEKGPLDKKDLQKVHQKGKREFEKTLDKIGSYEKKYIKQGIQKEEADFISKAQAFHELSYQKPLEASQMDTFLHVVRSGHVRASLYCHLYQKEIKEGQNPSLDRKNIPNPERQTSISQGTQDTMERMAKYRVFEEIKEILPRVLSTSQELSSKEVQKIQEKIETRFDKDHKAYGIREEKETRVREERILLQERAFQTQREKERALQKERDCGLER